MNIRQFDVLPRLPKALGPLREIAFNLHYCWDWEAVQLFIRMDPEYWEKTYQNPALMLSRLPQERFAELAKDDSFVANMKRVRDRLKVYMEAPTWMQEEHPEFAKRTFAYFSMEYGIDVSLPIYSGGLGALAGDHLKSASDLGLPLVAVGLLYREGYCSQYLTADGWQQEAYPINDWFNMPVERALGQDGQPVRSSIELDGQSVTFEIWRVQVGRILLFLLDTDLPENAPEQRGITKRLYVGDRDMRLRQEILLGVGGMRALAALGYEPCVCHMNEGHSAFMALERVRQVVERYRLSLAEAWEVVWATTVFTTHTPVPAGNERFQPDLVKRYLGAFVEKIGISWKEFLALGRENPANQEEDFCLTVLALRSAAHCNGVSQLHGRTSRRMWRGLWPGLPVEEIPISGLTNGIHTRSWLSHEMTELLDRYLGPKFQEEPTDFSVWRRVRKIPDSEMWRAHDLRRERLVWFARKRLRIQLERRGASPHIVQQADELLDPTALTICFGRRFAAYKRATLILKNRDRLRRLLNDPKRPVQIIFAGKAHPMDGAGKEVLKELVHFVREEGFREHIVFIEDYDMNVARYFVQGADVWLNTPRRPLEASGTSGMKAAVNGALNLSTLDGWWCEGYSPEVGWVIGSGEEYDAREAQDDVESSTLYDILEEEVIPLFYDRGRDGLPHGWIAKMKKSMEKIGAVFNTHRMMSDYVGRSYLAASTKHEELTAGSQERAKALAAWRGKLRERWKDVRIEKVDSDGNRALSVGDELEVTAHVRLGGLAPEDVEIQLYHGHLSTPGEIDAGESVRMAHERPAEGGVHLYRGRVPCGASGRRGFTVRVLPHHPDRVHPYEMGMVLWG
ncbi:MAG: alpha-glucan family phosphorylase [Elusimicrobiota bacterium]